MTIKISEFAKSKVISFLSNQSAPTFLRVDVTGQNAQDYLYRFYLDEKNSDQDLILEFENFKTIIRKQDKSKLEGATLDWVESVHGSGFKMINPNKPQNNLGTELAQKIQKLLDEDINPGVASHGGNIELLDVVDGTAYVKMSGGCQGCSSAKSTLKQGVEVRIKQMFPEITAVIDTTDHAQGANPYYSESSHSH